MRTTHKECRRCKKSKPRGEFPGRNGNTPRCKKCNEEMFSGNEYWDDMRAKKYGLTLAELRIFEKNADGKCQVCRSTMWTCIDHDHETGKVRGLLCPSCNGLLAGFDSRLRPMLEKYLKNHAEKEALGITIGAGWVRP